MGYTDTPTPPPTLKDRIKARLVSFGHDIEAHFRDLFNMSGGPYYYQVVAQESQLPLLLPFFTGLPFLSFLSPFLESTVASWSTKLTRHRGQTQRKEKEAS